MCDIFWHIMQCLGPYSVSNIFTACISFAWHLRGLHYQGDFASRCFEVIWAAQCSRLGTPAWRWRSGNFLVDYLVVTVWLFSEVVIIRTHFLSLRMNMFLWHVCWMYKCHSIPVLNHRWKLALCVCLVFPCVRVTAAPHRKAFKMTYQQLHLHTGNLSQLLFGLLFH